jgi:hypothetical protein
LQESGDFLEWFCSLLIRFLRAPLGGSFLGGGGNYTDSTRQGVHFLLFALSPLDFLRKIASQLFTFYRTKLATFARRRIHGALISWRGKGQKRSDRVALIVRAQEGVAKDL